jgi:hypothetical protein
MPPSRYSHTHGSDHWEIWAVSNQEFGCKLNYNSQREVPELPFWLGCEAIENTEELGTGAQQSWASLQVEIAECGQMSGREECNDHTPCFCHPLTDYKQTTTTKWDPLTHATSDDRSASKASVRPPVSPAVMLWAPVYVQHSSQAS